MTGLPSRFLLVSALSLLALLGFTSCESTNFSKDTRNKMIVSVSDQKMLLVRDGSPIKTYKISTSKFGVGDKPNSNCTPLGRMQVAKKIGDKIPLGSVLKNRRPTGEILKPDAPGRDPIVSRILWLNGTEARNKNAFRRTIYIHGTAEEWRLGSPASFGCIRMGSRDVCDLYNRIGFGADVFVIRGSLQSKKSNQASASAGIAANKTNG